MPPAKAPPRAAALKLLVRRVGDGLKVLVFQPPGSRKTEGGSVNIACFHSAVSSGQTFQKYSYVSSASRSRIRRSVSSSAIRRDYGAFRGPRLSLPVGGGTF